MCLVVADAGKAGTRNQATGLAGRLGLPVQLVEARLKPPYRWLPDAWLPPRLDVADLDGPVPTAAPRLVVSAGRHAAPISRALKKMFGAATLTVHVMDPRQTTTRFDLVVPPAHDRTRGPNVAPTLGALNGIDPAALAQAAAAWSDPLLSLPKPVVLVAVGGPTKGATFGPQVLLKLQAAIDAVAAAGGTPLVTPSRRTPPAFAPILRSTALTRGGRWWDGTGANPYAAWLGAAEAVIATGDSVSMLSEAATAGKPVYVLDVGGRVKFRRFIAAMVAEGYVKPFTGEVVPFAVKRLAETERIAALIAARLGLDAPGQAP